MSARTFPPLADRFWSQVDKHGSIPAACPELGECWNWVGNTKSKYGYGRIRANGTKRLAHHVAWFLEKGIFPTKCLLHKCDNASCVRTSHLFEGTRQENSTDFWKKIKAGTPWRTWAV